MNFTSLKRSPVLKDHFFSVPMVTAEYRFSVPARISKGQGAGPEKGLFSALLDFQKRHLFRDTVKSNKVYNEILTFIIYT